MSTTLVLALVLVGAGACLQGSVGFGMNLVAAPLLVVIDPRFVPGPLLMASVALTALTLVRDRRSLQLGEMGWAMVGRVPGSVVGALAVAALSGDALAVALALIVLAAVGASAAGIEVPVTRRTLVSAGAVSGFTATTTSVGGPPMALLLQHRGGEEVRSNLAAFFSVGSVLSVLLLVPAGDVGRPELGLGLLLVPPTLLGFAASTWTRHHVEGDRVRPAILVVAAASAVALLVRTLLG